MYSCSSLYGKFPGALQDIAIVAFAPISMDVMRQATGKDRLENLGPAKFQHG